MALINAGREAAADGDVRAMVEADTAYHRAIYAASGNPCIVDSASMHWIHLRRVIGAVPLQGGSRAGIRDEHGAICAAIRAGDGALAAAAHQ